MKPGDLFSITHTCRAWNSGLKDYEHNVIVGDVTRDDIVLLLDTNDKVYAHVISRFGVCYIPRDYMRLLL